MHDPLEREEAAFRRELPRLLAEKRRHHNGWNYALVKGDVVDSTWDTMLDAAQAGERLFGGEPFMVRKIEAVETPILVAGMVVSCRG